MLVSSLAPTLWWVLMEVERVETSEYACQLRRQRANPDVNNCSFKCD